MRKAWLFGLITLSALFFTGCSNEFGFGHNDNKYAQAKTAAPLQVPPGARVPQTESYYPVPTMPASANQQAPSIIPPGSHILQYMKKHHGHGPVAQYEINKAANTQDNSRLNMPQPSTKTANRANLTHLAANSLEINTTPNRAWQMLGSALAKSRYQVLDKDQSLGSYYVLDKQRTAGKITANTPIYRIYVKPDGHDAAVSVYDRNNSPLDPKIAQPLLAKLQQQLSRA